MTGRRVGAVFAAIVMIAGALLLRDQVLNDPDDPNDPGTAEFAGEIVCAADLAEICRAVERTTGFEIRVESAEDTLATWSAAEELDAVWITMAPFGEMVESLRARERLVQAEMQTTVLASSPLMMVANADIADALVAECGAEVDWSCLGTSGYGIGFSAFPRTAIGQFGVSSAVLGFGSGSAPSASNPDFAVWARQIAGNSDNGSGAATAVSVIQTRPSRFDVAVGVEAEMADPADPRFALLPPAGAPVVNVIIAQPGALTYPTELGEALSDELAAAGYTQTSTAADNGTLTGPAMLAIRELWKDFS